MPERIFEKLADYFSERCTNAFKPRFDTGATGNCELCAVPVEAAQPSNLVLTLTIVNISPAFIVGAGVTVTGTLTNNSSDALTSITASSTTPGFSVFGSSSLAAGATTIYGGNYTLTQADVAAGTIALSATLAATIVGTSNTIESNEATAAAT